MLRSILLAALLGTALAGCLDDGQGPPPDPEALDAEAPAAPTAYAGSSRATELALCPPTTRTCVGYWSVGFDDSAIRVGAGQRVTLDASWDAAVPELETLEVFLYQGSYFEGHRVVARAAGASPLTLTADDLGGGPFGVGFRGDLPASLQFEQEVAWTAVVEDG